VNIRNQCYLINLKCIRQSKKFLQTKRFDVVFCIPAVFCFGFVYKGGPFPFDQSDVQQCNKKCRRFRARNTIVSIGLKCTCSVFEQYVNYRRIEFPIFVAYPKLVGKLNCNKADYDLVFVIHCCVLKKLIYLKLNLSSHEKFKLLNKISQFVLPTE